MSACGYSCVLAKKNFRRPTTTIARLTQSHAISQPIAFSSASDQWKIRTSFTFFYFSKLFFIYNYWFLYHDDQKISWWRICRCVAGGQLRNPPAQFGCVNSDLGECFFWGLCKMLAGDRINWPLTPRDVYFFGNACNGRVWRQFRCLRLS